MSLKRVVVTGLGALTPIGNTVSEYWHGLINGVSGTAAITHFDASKFKTRFACEVKKFDIHNFLDRKDARKLDPYVHYALVASDEAIKDASLPSAKIDVNRVGIVWASGIGGLITFQKEVENFIEAKRIPKFNPFFIPKMISDIAAGHISIRNGYRGPNYGTVSACASSTHAMISAFDLIRLGKADIIVSGGSEAAIAESGVGGFNAMKALSERNDDPKTASRPFDIDRDGFVLGEGAGSLVFEEYEHAKKRNAKIYAEVAGGGMSADAHHITAPHPEGLGAQIVMTSTLQDANMKPKDIDYINVHGTSTPLGDISEIKAIKNVFGEHAYVLNISSTKSMTGHLLGAAGAAEAIACIYAINNNTIPPTINHFIDDPQIDPKLNLTFNKTQEKTIRTAISNTFGFGGHNASIVFKEIDR